MIGHKTSLNQFKKTEIISSIFSDHKGLKLETKPKGKNPKHSKSWRQNSMLLMNGSRTRLGKKSKTFWKQIFQANGQEKKTGVAILISDKIDFQRGPYRETQKVTS